MTRVVNTNMVVCDGCGVEITWAPVIVAKRTYCCRDCAEGRACDCDFPVEERDDHVETAPVLAY